MQNDSSLRRAQDGVRWRFVRVLQHVVLTQNVDPHALAEASKLPYRRLHDWIEGNHAPALGHPDRETVAKALRKILKDPTITVAFLNGADDGYEQWLATVDGRQDPGSVEGNHAAASRTTDK